MKPARSRPAWPRATPSPAPPATPSPRPTPPTARRPTPAPPRHPTPQTDLDDGSVTNVAFASGFFGSDPVDSPTDTETVTAIQSPALSIVKTATPATYDSVGDVVDYSYLVTNSGNVTLSGPFSVTDDQASDEACPVAASRAPGASITYPASHTITQTDLDDGSVTNVAFASGFFGSDPVDSPTDTETVTAIQSPALSIVKTATPATYDSVGDVVDYSYLVTNSGNVTLSGPFSVTDDQASDEACPVTASLAPGDSITCTASHTITQTDLDDGSVTNVAFASGFFGSDPVDSPTDTETVTAIQSPALSIVKTATPATYDSVGDVVDYSYLVTNSGNVTLSGPFSVTDDQASDEACPVAASLAPGDSITCTASHTITQTHPAHGPAPHPRPPPPPHPPDRPGRWLGDQRRLRQRLLRQRPRRLAHGHGDRHRHPEPGAVHRQDGHPGHAHRKAAPPGALRLRRRRRRLQLPGHQQWQRHALRPVQRD